ncbi:hypothetical protein EU244_026565 [Rhodococcus qingshengii]|uniref:hypothetical protein n=1 Tax=Rhodococcus qingshengii TaxID=334542 RepID=UPI001455FBE2|nr:hypothetical protein [Rhodococcus qingshengii]
MSHADSADDWWHSLPPERRIRLAEWIGRLDAARHREVEGQMPLLFHPHRR